MKSAALADSLVASQAYGRAGQIKPEAGAEAAQGGFGAALKEVINQTAEASAGSEQVAVETLTREADLVDVATAVTNAEVVLDTVVAVRDRVISAYQEIMRMPI